MFCSFNCIVKRSEGIYKKLGFIKRPHDWEGAGMEMELDI